MARQLRIQIADGVYHAYHRGNAKQPIFHDDRDRLRFLRALREARDFCGWSILTYCLMPNHHHVVIRTPKANLAQGMKHLHGTYTQAFNRRYESAGHVFQGRYGARLIQRDEHLIATLGYIAANPLRAGLCRRPEDWRWSGHAAIVGLATSRLVDVDATLALLAGHRGDALATYRAAVERADSQPPEVPAKVVAGDGARPSLCSLFAHNSDALADAHFTYGYTQLQLAEHLGCHPSTVCRRLRAATARCNKGPDPV
jgi:putative transposase